MSVNFALQQRDLLPTSERLRENKLVDRGPAAGFRLGARRGSSWDSWSEASALPSLISETAGPVLQALSNDLRTVSRISYTATSLRERLFDARVQLKIATSQYAMHLPANSRSKLFTEFDYLLDEEAWHDGDRLPTLVSYNSFLKWLIHTGDCSWSSLGISDSGTIMAAWVRGRSRLTADFADRVRWSQAVMAEGELQTSAGQFSLEHFAKRASDFLGALKE